MIDDHLKYMDDLPLQQLVIHSFLVGYLIYSWVWFKFVHPWEYSPQRFLYSFIHSTDFLLASLLCHWCCCLRHHCKKSNTHPPLDTHLSMLHPHIHPCVCRQSIHPSRNSLPVLLFIHTAAFFVKGWFCHSCRHCTARSVNFHPHYSSTPHSTSIYLHAFIYIQVNISSIHECIRRSSSVVNLASMSVSALVSLSTVQLSLCVSPAVLQAVQHSSSLDVLSSTIDFIYLSSRIHPRALSLR